MVFVFRPEIDTSSIAQDEKPPATMGEVFDTTLESVRFGYEGLSRFRAFEAAYDARSDRWFEATGVRLENPYRVKGLAPQEMIARGEAGDAWSFFDKRERELAEQHPDKGYLLATTVAEDAARLSREADARELDAWERSSGPGKYFAYTAATLYAAATDPVNLAGAAIGPAGPVGVGAKAVLWRALQNGAVNAGTEAAVQPFVQSWRQEAGLDYGLSQAALSVAAAGVLGFGLDAGVRGAARGVRKLQGREAILDDAGGVIGYKAGEPVLDASDSASLSRPDAPRPRLPDPREDPRQDPRQDPLGALDAAAERLPDDHPIRRASRGDIAALSEAAEKLGVAEQPEVRVALDVMVRDEVDFRAPDGIDAREHAGRLNDAMRAVVDDAALPPGTALALPHDETAGAARIAEVLSQDPVQLAAAIRENPQMLREGLPWQDQQLRDAALLSRLSEPAFEMVAGGTADAKLAALVADHVADPERHAGLLRQLTAVAPQTAADARAALAGLLEAPRAPEARAALANAAAPLERPVSLIDDPSGPAAARQLEGLRARFADEIEQAQAGDDAAGASSAAKVADKGAASAAAGAIDKLTAALDAAIGRLPRGVTAKSFADIEDLPEALRRDVMFARLQGYHIEGLTDRTTGNIWIAHDALDPERVIGHETVHALRQTGVLTDAELKVLARKAAELPDLFDRAAYEALYRGQPHAEEALLQEAAAHLYEARANGANFGRDVNAILHKIRQFLERVRNALEGLGWRSADDIMTAIESGAIAKRSMRQVELPGGGSVFGTDGKPVASQALFSLRADARSQLRADMEALKAIDDAKLKAQRERQALLDEAVRQRNESFVTTLKDARGQIDPAKALIYLIENHGEVDMPAGMASVAGEAKAIENMAKAGMEEVLDAFRPQLGTGLTRNRARLENVVRELAGEGTGDKAAAGLAQTWAATHERLRQEFNAAGGDIPKLEGWFLPQIHDRAALLAAGPDRWLDDILRGLDRARIIDEATGAPITRERLADTLRGIWQNVTSDGHGTLAANLTDPFGGVTAAATGATKLANRRQEHRFLHFKNAAAWLEYQKQYGGGGDPFGAMMSHVTGMSKDIAALRVLGSNPNRELARLARFALKQAALARPAARVIDDAVAKVKRLGEELLASPTRLSELSEQIGAIHKEMAAIREKRIGPPSHRSKKKLEALSKRLAPLDAERAAIVVGETPRVDSVEAARIRAELTDAFDELAAAQETGKVLFPKRTELLGKTMDRAGARWSWTANPEDYARTYVKRAEAMWDLYTGVTSMPVNAKWAERMQTLRNVAVVGRGGSMVISSIADNFAQVMARRFTGLPLARTFGDVIAQFGNRRAATRAALIGETYLHMFNDGARQAAALRGGVWSSYLAERTIAWQGLNHLTDAQRRAFGMTIQGEFADRTEKTLAELAADNPRLSRLFRRYGLTATDWDAIRLDPSTGKPRQVDFLSPNLVRDSLEAAGRGAERVAERYLAMILQESDFASPVAMLRARAALVGKNQPGTLLGEGLRVGTQFKSFAVMFWMLHVERQMREAVINGGTSAAVLMSEVAIAMTLGGALVVQLKELKSGRDPQPMDNANFWYRAALQGGGLGIMGDLIAAETNRFGGGIVSTIGGPAVGIVEDVLRPAANLYKRKESNVGRDVAKLATGYVPGASLWYLNLAYKRLAADRLQEFLDPQAYEMFHRSVQNQRRDYGNEYWWGPGDRRAERGPRLDSAVGGS